VASNAMRTESATDMYPPIISGTDNFGDSSLNS
jgi:hypothetical protein